MIVAYLLWALRLLQLAIFLRVMLTWISPNPGGMRNLRWFTDPMDRLLKPFSVTIPMGHAYLDLGPMLALFLIEGISRVLIYL